MLHKTIERVVSKPKITGIKPYSISRWMKSLANGGMRAPGDQRRPYYRNKNRPRNQEIEKYINDKVRFEIAVVRCKGEFQQKHITVFQSLNVQTRSLKIMFSCKLYSSKV